MRELRNKLRPTFIVIAVLIVVIGHCVSIYTSYVHGYHAGVKAGVEATLNEVEKQSKEMVKKFDEIDKKYGVFPK